MIVIQRLLVLSLLLGGLTSTTLAQSVFRASPIDQCQDERLDALEKSDLRIEAKLEAILAKLEVKTCKVVELQADGGCADGQCDKPEKLPAPVAVSARYTTSELQSLIRAKRPGGWRGPVYADVSPRSMAKQHLVGSEHGFTWDQVSGLTQEQALILHDLAPSHGNQIFPTRSGTASASVRPVVTRSVTTTTTQSVQASSGCANGQCARQQSSVQYRRGLFGFGLLGR